jgi:cytoskeletal protein RodZ
MELFGKKLQDARVARGLDFDQVSRETNITRRYLEALEKEDFSVFPGEPYLLGFLRNYCDYLGLNSNEFVAAYKNIKIQESPVPLMDLIPKRTLSDALLSSPNLGKIIGGTVAVILIVIVGIVGISIAGKMSGTGDKEEVAAPSRESATYSITGEEFKHRVYIGDVLNVTTPSGLYTIQVAETAPAVKLTTPTGDRIIELGQDLLIDLSGDNENDVKIFVADLFKNNPEKGADIQVSSGAALLSTGSDTPVGEVSTTNDVTVPVTGAVATTNAHQTVLFEGGSAYPVSMNATFRGYCLFRYEADKSTRDERYYQKSELLTVQANNGIRIWASNGNSVKLQIIAGGKTAELEVSRPGEVMVRDLKWLKDEESGRYKFVVMDID